MALTIHQDSIGNKYIGYAGDVTAVATGQEVNDEIVNFLESFPNVKAAKTINSFLLWRTDGVVPDSDKGSTKSGDSFFGSDFGGGDYFLSFNAKDAGPSEVQILTSAGPNPSTRLLTKDNCVAYSNGVDLGVFGWDYDNNNDVAISTFTWVGEVKGNSNIATPQTRSGIVIINGNSTQESISVKQPDSTTKRLHLDTESGASHNIDCAEETGRLFLIEDDGAGADAGIVGYCENLYISKQTGLTIGGFVTVNGITDGGSTHGIVVGDWGTDAKIIMRVYDG